MKAVNGDDVVFLDKKERPSRLRQKQTRKRVQAAEMTL